MSPDSVSIVDIANAMRIIATVPGALWGKPQSVARKNARCSDPRSPLDGANIEASETVWHHPNGWRLSQTEEVISVPYCTLGLTMTYRNYWISSPSDDVGTHRQLHYIARDGAVLKLSAYYQVAPPTFLIGPYDSVRLSLKTDEILQVNLHLSSANPLYGQVHKPPPLPVAESIRAAMSHWLPADLYQTIREETESATDPAA